MRFLHFASLLSLPLLLACSSVPVNRTTDPTANFALVSPGVYRGARPDRAGLEELAKLQFRTIINLEDAPDAIEAERVAAAELGMTQVVRSMTGTESPSGQLVGEVLSMLADPSLHPVFVHCMKGQDRTGAIIALHRVFNEGWSARDARDEMYARGFNKILLSLSDYVELKTGLD